MKSGTISLLVLACLMPLGAKAQSTDKAAAESLFNEGRKLMQENKLDPGCDKLAESQRLDPAAGTLLNLADCRERQGRTATAWAAWLEAAAAARTAGQTDRETLARQRADALRPRLVTLTIEVPESSRVSGLSLTRDGNAVGAAVWGSAVPVDPGQHAVSATAPGYESWETAVTIREGSPASVVVPPLVQSAAALAPVAAPPSVVTAGAGPPRAASDGGSQGPPALSYVAAGVGVIGLGVGTVFGLRAINKNDDSKTECPSSTNCNAAGKTLRDEAFGEARVSTVGFVIGGVGVAAAAVFWIAAPKEETPKGTGVRVRRVAAHPASGGLNLAVEGAF